MAILDGKEGTLTFRDDEIFTDLFLARYLTAPQIAWLHFGSQSRARARLSGLRAKGWTTSIKAGDLPAAWTLTREGFTAYADQFRTGEQYASKQLGPRRLEHYLNTNDLYVAVKPVLEQLLGPYPAWEWRNEARAFRPKTHSGRNTAHQPDAEVRFGGLVFVVERQTRRARKGPRPIYEKVAAHKTYINYDLEDPGSGEILFICDEPRDATLAERAGDQLGVSVFAGNTRQAAAHLDDAARRLPGAF